MYHILLVLDLPMEGMGGVLKLLVDRVDGDAGDKRIRTPYLGHLLLLGMPHHVALQLLHPSLLQLILPYLQPLIPVDLLQIRILHPFKPLTL